MCKQSVTALGVAALLLSSTAQPLVAQATASDTPHPLDAVLTVLMDATSTSMHKDALVGKRYTGVITVNEVAAQTGVAAPMARITVQMQGTADRWYYFWMAFDTPDLQNAAKLRKGSQARITGHLSAIRQQRSGYSNVPPTEWADFTAVTIDEILN